MRAPQHLYASLSLPSASWLPTLQSGSARGSFYLPLLPNAYSLDGWMDLWMDGWMDGLCSNDYWVPMGQHVNWHRVGCVFPSSFLLKMSLNTPLKLHLNNLWWYIWYHCNADHKNMGVDITSSVLSCLVQEIWCKTHHQVMAGSKTDTFLWWLHICKCPGSQTVKLY